MTQLMDGLKRRRSIRKYQNRPVPMETVVQILETAAYAPSAHNAQPWRFIILAEEKQKEALARAMGQAWLCELEKDHASLSESRSAVDRSVGRFVAAPVLIVACLTLKDMDRYSDAEHQGAERELAVQSVAAAVQTLLLAAHASGLGACWYCAPIFCKPAVREALGVPDNVEPQALITVGYPSEEPRMPARRQLGEFAHFGRWGGRH